MRKVEIELMTVTPLFLGGSDPRGQPPELRPPSFRGAMRYWYRAALGGVVGDNWNEVRRLEGEVFGITSEGSESQSQNGNMGIGSPVTLRIIPRNNPQIVEYKRERRLPPPGKDYLFWSLAQSGSVERGNFQPNRKYIKEGFTFSVILSSRFSSNQTDRALRHAIYSLWLSLNLGGIGARSRRMAGSLAIKEPVVINDIEFGVPSSDLDDVVQYLERNLLVIRNGLKEDCKTSEPLSISQFSKFDILNPKVCKIWILDSYKNSTEALNGIGDILRKFRSRREPDHIETVERAQFGLPLVYRYSDKTTGTIIAEHNEAKIERRASPLWLSTLNCKDGKVFSSAVLFYSQFLPEGSKLAVKNKNSIQKIPPPEKFDLIEDWIENSFPNRREVNYG